MTRSELKTVQDLIDKLEDLVNRVPRWRLNGIQDTSTGKDEASRELVEESNLLNYISSPYTPFVGAHVDGLEISKDELKKILEGL